MFNFTPSPRKYSAFRKISQQHHLKLLPLSRYFPDIAEVAHGRGVPISRVSLRMEGLTVCVSPQKFIGGLGGNISWRSLSHAQLQAPSPGRLWYFSFGAWAICFVQTPIPLNIRFHDHPSSFFFLWKTMHILHVPRPAHFSQEIIRYFFWSTCWPAR